MTELEKELQTILKQVEDSQLKLRKYNETLRHYYIRLEEISAQYKRKAPISDTNFETDFRTLVEGLRALSDENYTFWRDVRTQYYNKYKDTIDQEFRFLVKQIKGFCASFTRQADELFTLYKNLQRLTGDLPLRLNWWLFENAVQDLQNTAKRILFLVRSMEKSYA